MNKESNMKIWHKGNKIYFAFTLAEILITFVIIGVISALTIPGVIKNYKARVLRNQFYKSYNQVSQVLQRMKYENGGEIWENYANYNKLGNTYRRDEFKNDFFSYFKETKSDNASYYVLSYDNPSDPYGIGRFNKGCWYGESFIISNSYSVCTGINAWLIYIALDTNTSKKGPNRHGYDIFRFLIKRNTNDKLSPYNDYGTRCGTQTAHDCSWYALNDISPDNPNIGYWKGLK